MGAGVRMPSTAHRGRAFEQRVKVSLQKEGYFVVRCAASKPCDLVAIKGGKVTLIECKNYEKPSLSDERKIVLMGAETGCSCALAFNADGVITWRRWE